MNMKSLALSMGVGAAMGAVAIMMTPKNSSARKLVDKAATKMEDMATMMGEKIVEKMDF